MVKVLHPTGDVQFAHGGSAAFIPFVKLWMKASTAPSGASSAPRPSRHCAADSRNDVLSTGRGAHCRSAVPHRLGCADGLMGAGVAAFILISGWGLAVMDNAQPAAGSESPSEDLVDHIEQKVLSYPGVLGWPI